MRSASTFRVVEYDARGGRTAFVVLGEGPAGEPVAAGEVNEFLTGLFASRVPRNTQRARAFDLALWLGFCADTGRDWIRVSHRDVTVFQARLFQVPSGLPLGGPASVVCISEQARTAGTVRRALQSVKAFYRWAGDAAVVGGDVAASVAIVRMPKVAVTRTIRGPVAAEVDAIFAFLAARPRETLLASLMYWCGLRISEAVSLRFDDLHFKADNGWSGCSVAGAHLHVRPNEERALPVGAAHKSRRERIVPVPDEVKAHFVAYMGRRSEQLGGFDACPFVLVSRSGGTVQGWRPDSARRAFNRMSHAIGIPANPHLLRHAFASDLVEAGAQLEKVQELLGHATLESTRVYVHSSDRALRNAVVSLSEYREGLRA